MNVKWLFYCRYMFHFSLITLLYNKQVIQYHHSHINHSIYTCMYIPRYFTRFLHSRMLPQCEIYSRQGCCE